MTATPCPTCKTPLTAEGTCVTCAAAAEGLALVGQNAYPLVRATLERLEAAGLAPEMEEVPSAGADEAALRRQRPPVWNLYVPEAELPRAKELILGDWTAALDDEAREAAARGQGGVDLDAGGEIVCPACGTHFTAQGADTECPECGLGLGAPGGDDDEPGPEAS